MGGSVSARGEVSQRLLLRLGSPLLDLLLQERDHALGLQPETLPEDLGELAGLDHGVDESLARGRDGLAPGERGLDRADLQLEELDLLDHGGDLGGPGLESLGLLVESLGAHVHGHRARLEVDRARVESRELGLERSDPLGELGVERGGPLLDDPGLGAAEGLDDARPDPGVEVRDRGRRVGIGGGQRAEPTRGAPGGSRRGGEWLLEGTATRARRRRRSAHGRRCTPDRLDRSRVVRHEPSRRPLS